MRVAVSLAVVLAIALANAPAGDAQRRNPVPATIPVLQIPPGATPPEAPPMRQAIEPLPISARIEITQKALGSSSPLQPSGQPIRLSAAAPSQGLSGLRVSGELNGALDFIWLFEPTSALTLYYAPVEPGSPHLLECGCDSSLPDVHVRVAASGSVDISSQTTFVELSSHVLHKSDRRIMTVVKPSQPQIQLQLTIGKYERITVMYCELTPFK